MTKLQPKKERLDKVLVDRGLTPSRKYAQSLILEGKVRVDGERADKPGHQISPSAELHVKGELHPYVSRGGVKLEKALRELDVNVKGKVALDVGASTGGFTDCLLHHGALRVYAVDVGYGQLAWKLQKDPRVVSLDRRNIRTLPEGDIAEKADIATVDTSFISLKKVLPRVKELLGQGGEILALVKPQFEVGKGEVGKKGIVREQSKHRQVLEDLCSYAERIDLTVLGIIESPLLGTKGNKEFFLYLRKQGP